MPQKTKKILFIITNQAHGRGGHFYTLRTTIDALKDMITPLVIEFGMAKVSSPILKEAKGAKFFFIPYKNIWETLKKSYFISKNEMPDVIHSFDSPAFFLGRILAVIFSIPHIHTKCGGPNPRIYYPIPSCLILFSEENLNYFKKKDRYKNTRIELIPNRVITPKTDERRIKSIREKIKKDDFIILRIGRICTHYNETLKQCIELTQKLNQDGVNVQLVLIGVIQDNHLIEELKIRSDRSILLLNEEEYTTNSAELIDIADMVVGTGRSFMEAALFGKPLLAPTDTTLKIPVLVDQENINIFSQYNFSPRVPGKLFCQEIEYEKIITVIKNHRAYQENSNFIKNYAHKNFLIDQAIPKIIELYNTKSKEKIRPLDSSINCLLLLKSMRKS